MKRFIRNQAGFSRLGIIIAIILVVAALAVFFILYPWEKEPIKIGAMPDS